MKITHHNKPWEYVIIDDFLSPERFKTIEDLAIQELGRYQVEGPNTPRGKYIRFTKEDLLPEVTLETMNLMDHREYDDLVKLNHWAIMPPNTQYPIHIDNISRIHTSTFYIAPEKSIGSILCDNPSTNDDGDHGPPNEDSICEYPIPWKTNRLFAHNPRPMQWHRYMSGDTCRINLSVFFADPNKIRPHRQDLDYFID
tara:strand:+ start:516 stop:1109 length:594 start_codon:yes stop_codon:yes gene_type:complete